MKRRRAFLLVLVLLSLLAASKSPRARKLLRRLRLAWIRWVLVPLTLSSKVKLVYHPKPGLVGSTDLGSLVARCLHLGGERAYFTPTPWLLNGHAHTLYCTIANFSNVDHIEYERHTIRLPDGGTLGLDFTTPVPGFDESQVPILVVQHGLTGGSYESYVRHVLAAISKPKEQGGNGWRGVVVNFRGCAGVPITSQKLYHAGQTDDLRCALLYLAAKFPRNPLYAIGFSLGANSLAKYLGEEGEKTPIKGACVVAGPWDLHAGHCKLSSSWIGGIYSTAMAGNLRRMLKRHLHAFEGNTLFDPKDVWANPRQSLYEFDSIVTRQVGGFPPSTTITQCLRIVKSATLPFRRLLYMRKTMGSRPFHVCL